MSSHFSAVARTASHAPWIALLLSIIAAVDAVADSPAALRTITPVEPVPAATAPRAALRSVVVEPQAVVRQAPPEAPLPEIVPLSTGSVQPTSASQGQTVGRLEPTTQRPDAGLPPAMAAGEGEGRQPAALPAQPRMERRAVTTGAQPSPARAVQACAVFGPTNCAGSH